MGIESLTENLNLQGYINRAWQRIAEIGIDMNGMSADHIGIRIPWGEKGEGDYSPYLLAKRYLESIDATLVSEAIIPMTIEGRPIAIYKLLSSIDTEGGKVWYVEVPAPRKGRMEEDKLDHIEIVLKDGESLASFIDKNKDILKQFTSQNLNEIALKESNSVNPDVTLSLGNGIVVKFHTKDIGYVVTHEQQASAIRAIQNSLISAFKENTSGVMNV